MKVRAKTPMYYAGAMKAVGEVYEMDDREESEATILVHLGKIELVKDEPKPAQRANVYDTRAMKADSEAPKPGNSG